jgi:hypothetical protein
MFKLGFWGLGNICALLGMAIGGIGPAGIVIAVLLLIIGTVFICQLPE